MKYKIIYLLVLLLVNVCLKAQTLQGISYQSSARNANGNIMVNQAINVRFTIHDSIANGAAVYQETNSTTTNAQGMFSLNMGLGTPTTGNFNQINWGNNAKFMQVELSTNGGTNYTDMGTQQMMSVPYALYAKNATNGMPNGNNVGDMLYWTGTTWNTITSGSYGQTLINCNEMPTWGGCLPIISTQNATNVTGDLATLSGTIINNGGTSITQKGFCWSTSQNPTLANSFTNEGGGLGSFSTQLTGLTGNTTYYVRAYAINGAGTAYGNQVVFTTLTISLPVLNTITANQLTSNSAISGGNITFDGNATITDKGICWSINSNPTISGSHFSEGTGIGSFTNSYLSGLLPSTTYYVRSYATNISGTAYGNQISFITAPTIGQTYQGGIVFYILQPGDTNYNPNVVHGLIAAPSEQGLLYWGCNGSCILSTSIQIGSGQSNSTAIVNGCSDPNSAAKICDNLVLSGYSDWYLPSLNELIKLKQNIGTSLNSAYWSSSEINCQNAYSIDGNGTTYIQNSSKQYQMYVRAIRSF